MLRDNPVGRRFKDRIELLYDDRRNTFLLHHSSFGKVEVVALEPTEFLKLIESGLEHFKIGPETKDAISTVVNRLLQ